jgi:hypothetical protein
MKAVLFASHAVLFMCHGANLYVLYQLHTVLAEEYLFERRSTRGWNYFINAIYIALTFAHVAFFLLLRKNNDKNKNILEIATWVRAFSIGLYAVTFIQLLMEIYVYVYHSLYSIDHEVVLWISIQLLLSFIMMATSFQIFQQQQA